ncbi:MAG: AzlC family ABC transporter permease [Actinomycetota bacterium]|nr:AzlC family ABC transporter permease [Actinomycetota bacterium]
MDPPPPEDSYVAGARAALPLIVPTLLIGASFGVAAAGLGWGVVAPVVMSTIVFSGSAQFAIASVLGAGGGVIAAILAAVLVNGRFLAMGVAIGPSMRGSRVRRALEGQAIIDTSLVLARTAPARFGPRRLLGATAPQFTCWVLGTLAGVLLGEGIVDPKTIGLDALFPAFFLYLLVTELRSPAGRPAAAAAALIALVLIPITPPGLPVIAACAAVLLRRRRP